MCSICLVVYPSHLPVTGMLRLLVDGRSVGVYVRRIRSHTYHTPCAGPHKKPFMSFISISRSILYSPFVHSYKYSFVCTNTRITAGVQVLFEESSDRPLPCPHCLAKSLWTGSMWTSPRRSVNRAFSTFYKNKRPCFRSFVIWWEWVRSPNFSLCASIVHMKLRKLKHDQITHNAVSLSFVPFLTVFDCLPLGIHSHRVRGKFSGGGAIWGGAPGYCCGHPGKRLVAGACTTSITLCQKA